MLIEIDGLPGGNKSTLVSALASALHLPELPATTVDLEQTHRADDPNVIALVCIGHLAGRADGPESGVRKWTSQSASTYFSLRFSPDSATPAATIYAATFAHLKCPKPQLLVLVDLTVDQSAHHGGGGLTLPELTELKMAEQKTAYDVVVRGPITQENCNDAVNNILKLLDPTPTVSVAKFM